jgi:hypothetical protein
MDNSLTGIKCKRIALPDVNVSLIGSQEWLREKYGMGENAITEAVKETIRK